ncbi:hypothetical protein Ancab_026899 [Ancistrocladus abbreviatus]
MLRVVMGIGEQVYSALLLSFFFLQVYVFGFIPYIGKALNFLLLSWMYAYYCFEYKWNLSGVSLDRRLDFFESNWAFFAGFVNLQSCLLPIKGLYLTSRIGTFYLTADHAQNKLKISIPIPRERISETDPLIPIVSEVTRVFWAIFFLPPLESYAVMATLFPLFVLAATSSEADQLISSKRKNWRGAKLGRLPIFCVADTLSLKVLSLLPFRASQEQAPGQQGTVKKVCNSPRLNYFSLDRFLLSIMLAEGVQCLCIEICFSKLCKFFVIQSYVDC